MVPMETMGQMAMITSNGNNGSDGLVVMVPMGTTGQMVGELRWKYSSDCGREVTAPHGNTLGQMVVMVPMEIKENWRQP